MVPGQGSGWIETSTGEVLKERSPMGGGRGFGRRPCTENEGSQTGSVTTLGMSALAKQETDEDKHLAWWIGWSRWFG